MAASTTQPFVSSAATARFPSQPRSASSATMESRLRSSRSEARSSATW